MNGQPKNIGLIYLFAVLMQETESNSMGSHEAKTGGSWRLGET